MMGLPDAEALVTELVHKLKGRVSPQTAMVGIRTGGAWLAERLHEHLGVKVPLGTLDISFYRDDYNQAGLHASLQPSQIPFDVNGCDILLVDDVLYTGRTTRAALNELFDYGRPKCVHLVVLVDRAEQQLPIAAQFVGATLTVPDGKILRLARDDAGRLDFKLTDAKPAA